LFFAKVCCVLFHLGTHRRHCLRTPARLRKISFRDMREQGVRGVPIAPTIIAAVPSRSTPTPYRASSQIACWGRVSKKLLPVERDANIGGDVDKITARGRLR
jgi:hypothetical protein